MSIISDFETFPSPDSSAYRPNYREIYRYLGELLSGNETHELKPLGMYKIFMSQKMIQARKWIWFCFIELELKADLGRIYWISINKEDLSDSNVQPYC